MVVKGIQSAGKRPINWSKIREITQGPKEDPLTFMERCQEYLRVYTNTHLDLT
jgi:hypothetical protein